MGSIGQWQDVGVLNRNVNDTAAPLDSIDVITVLNTEGQNLLNMLYQCAQPVSSGEGDSIFIEPLELPISCIDSMLGDIASPIEHQERREDQSEHEEGKYRHKLDNMLKDGIAHSWTVWGRKLAQTLHRSLLTSYFQTSVMCCKSSTHG